MLSRNEIEARVAVSATILDQHVPDWVGRIDLKTLDVSNSQYCLLGQLYGSFEIGTRALQDLGVTAQSTEGFVANTPYQAGGHAIQKEYRQLTKAWGAYVERQQARQLDLAA